MGGQIFVNDFALLGENALDALPAMPVDDTVLAYAQAMQPVQFIGECPGVTNRKSKDGGSEFALRFRRKAALILAHLICDEDLAGKAGSRTELQFAGTQFFELSDKLVIGQQLHRLKHCAKSLRGDDVYHGPFVPGDGDKHARLGRSQGSGCLPLKLFDAVCIFHHRKTSPFPPARQVGH